MSIDASLLAILACPNCRGELRDETVTEAGTVSGELVCTSCGYAYPVRDAVPVLLVDEARRPDAPAAG